MGNLLNFLKIGEDFLLDADFFDRVELLSAFRLFVEEVCVFIS